jgi:mono/diheme cytochrome c family protein
MRRLYLTAGALIGLSLTVFGQNTSYQQDPGWRAPAEAVAKPNPLGQRQELAAGGQKLFRRNCVECHGEDGGGLIKKHGADLQLPLVQQQTDGTLFWKITNGNTDRGMPSFSKLPELQRWQLVLYLRTLRPSPAPTSQDKEK